MLSKSTDKDVSTQVTIALLTISSDAGWSSLVARRAHNPKVVGSNPAPATKKILKILRIGPVGPFLFLLQRTQASPFFISKDILINDC